ncbi:hypothetical protein [Proteus hauseri]|uniref:hypothetical protein n=1 Tax=Proteus hauseri TaxID=183417 RepID=UPI0032DA700F
MKIAPLSYYYSYNLDTVNSLNKTTKYRQIVVESVEDSISTDALSPLPIKQDFYRPSELNSEEDTYIRQLQRQRNFVPQVNLFNIVWQRSVRVFNSPVFLIKRTYRYVEEMARSSLLKSDKKKQLSSAFIAIGNSTEE